MTIVFMKIEKISENKLKITVPMSYFEEKNISFENFDGASEKAQEFFFELIEKIEEEYGLGFLSSRLVIETLPSDTDDVVFILTKPENSDSQSALLEKYMGRRFGIRTTTVVKTEKSVTKSPNSNIYVFNNFDDLCEFSKLVSPMYIGFNSAYKLNNKYYLVLDKKATDKIEFKMNFDYLVREYANEIENSAFYEGYLNEYGNLLVLGNAIDSLKLYLN